MTNPNASNNADAAPGAPLQGLRVLEFGQYIAVPAATQLLADLGAEVIKVEPPAGDSARWVGWSRDDCGPMFTAYNRGKRSVVLDLRSEAARAQALALALRADVVVNNMRPGIMARLGLDAARLMALSPRLVVGQVSGFGQDGPASVRPGYDVAAQAESGMMSMNGDPDRVPTRVGYTVVDATAARTLATGVLAALVRRGVTGRGGLVDLSLVDVAIEAADLVHTPLRRRLVPGVGDSCPGLRRRQRLTLRWGRGRTPGLMLSSTRLSARCTSNAAAWPGLSAATAVSSCDTLLTALPSTCTITSPTCRPACSAGPPSRRPSMTTPSSP